ncbi:dipeptidase [Kocuria sp. JC486]|uniref:Dipeptidase n=1 Tax=Kocuria soli TaxID=2485125 RepID=A0A3N3ZWJ6_9MICC|nr:MULTISPECIES: dipeptidase [Kocuria]NHU84076.1 dipeptidase [Kocuria sp. JC486]ROZ64766.1 dipeptidase [Kocuria soli]
MSHEHNPQQRTYNPQEPVEAQSVEDLDVAAFRRANDEGFEQVMTDLKNLVSIPGLAWESFDHANLEHSAHAVRDLLVAEGFPSVEIHAADGDSLHPAIIARKPAEPGKPTVLLYAHHDVQPPGDLTAWSSDPFVADERSGRLYGRGAADDKAGIMAHVGAIRVLRKMLGDDHGLGITVFIEGEEEVGSPHFGQFLERHQEKLAADAIVIADSANWEAGAPTLTTGLRGVVGAEVTVRVLDHALHSGGYGGPILDAPTLLARLIASLHDDDGAVAVEGLVHAPEPAIDYPEDRFRADAGLLEGMELAGRGSITSRLWSQPAISVTGIDATRVDVASNTIAPSARAKISLRIAPGQDPQAAADVLTKHLESHAPFGAQVEVGIDEKGPAFSTDTSSDAAQEMLWALSESWQRDALEAGMGGSIPFTAQLREKNPQATILITGVEDPDTRAHGIDESLHIEDFRLAVLAEALWLARRSRARA